ncbi:rRNA methyltransferase 3, mitochondrial [Osmia bicornis bicornis]|uniref:rRNA methyltransferase 3, mitochondrial n=1 Tax=Osmia bicornis bicornis TaxID=1437191 RepID=UPI001EAEFD26|nr:rRNA methyltransferase 3, mitochondrial [Osmia bicornis bicornis]
MVRMVFLNVLHNIVRPLRYANTCQTIHLNVTRQYARWISRRPVAIANEDELFESEDTTQEKPLRPKTFPRKQRKKKPVKKPTEITEEKYKFTNLKESDKIVSKLLTELKSRKRRGKNDEVVLEGCRLIKDALKAGAVPKAILFNDPSDIKELNIPEKVTLYKVPYKTLQLWSGLTASPGLLGIFNTPDVENTTPADNALPVTIICDNVREPGNLGSIMRAAAGVGCEKLIIMKGCVDLWNPKVLRSAAGTHFHLPIHAFPVWDDIPSLIGKDSNVFVTDSNFGDEYISEYSPNMLESSMNIFDINPEELKNKFGVNEETNEASRLIVPKNKKMMKSFMLNLPIVPYYSLDYTQTEIVIILSGETEGLSLDCYKFLSERKSIRINIPLVKGVDSLNTGVALGIVAFEIKRQILKKQSQL